MADRKLPTSTSTPPVSGAAYMDAVADRVGTLFDASAMRAVGITNAGNDYTIEVDPALDADVVTGMSFYVQPTVTNDGPGRLRVHSGNPYYDLSQSDGSPLAPGEFRAGTVYLIVFMSGQFMIVSGGAGGASTLVDYQTFDEGGTWTKPVGLDEDALVLVEAWGGGGGGAGGGTYRGGGGGGAYVWRWLRAAEVGETEVVQVGSGGTASTNPGGTGGSSAFGAHVIAYGGGGGVGVGAGTSTGGGGGGGGWGSAGGAANSESSGINGDLYSPLFGGGVGATSRGYTGGNTAGYGGGGGGSGFGPGGTSLFGGDGGDYGQAGASRGGGGGGGAPGGRGEVVVRVIRPGSRAAASAISIPDGTAAEPGLAFADDPDTGIVRTGENEIGFVTGGMIGMKLSGERTLFQSGSAAAPSIARDGDTNTGFFFPDEDQVAAVVDGAEVARFTPTGLAIGKSSASYLLDIAGAARLEVMNIVGTAPVINFADTDDGVTGQIGSGTSDFNIASNVSIDIRPNNVRAGFISNSGWQFFANETEVARFTSAGFGIGTSIPNTDLHISSAYPAIRLQDTDAAYSQIHANGSILALQADPLNAAASSRIQFEVDNLERMRVDGEGRLLIGTTINRGRLTIAGQGFGGYGIEHIAEGVSQESIVALLGTNTSGSASQQAHLVAYQPDGGGAADAALDFRVRGSVGSTFGDPGTIMTLLGSGRVGIDTALPIYPLDVVGALACTSPGTASVIAHSGDATNYSAVRFRQTATESRLESFNSGTGAATPMTYVVGGAERVRIDTSGNLLIGTSTTGASKLRVSGLPTNSAGLSPGDVWNDAGTLKIA